MERVYEGEIVETHRYNRIRHHSLGKKLSPTSAARSCKTISV